MISDKQIQDYMNTSLIEISIRESEERVLELMKWRQENIPSAINDRRVLMDDGAYYKRVNNVWDSPMEHKHKWDVPQLRRK